MFSHHCLSTLGSCKLSRENLGANVAVVYSWLQDSVQSPDEWSLMVKRQSVMSAKDIAMFVVVGPFCQCLL